VLHLLGIRHALEVVRVLVAAPGDPHTARRELLRRRLGRRLDSRARRRSGRGLGRRLGRRLDRRRRKRAAIRHARVPGLVAIVRIIHELAIGTILKRERAAARDAELLDAAARTVARDGGRAHRDEAALGLVLVEVDRVLLADDVDVQQEPLHRDHGPARRAALIRGRAEAVSRDRRQAARVVARDRELA